MSILPGICFRDLAQEITIFKPRSNSIYKAVYRKRLGGTFPNRQNPPSFLLQQVHFCRIPFSVSDEFPCPEISPRFWNLIIPAPLMSVPEASMNENDSPEPAHNDLGAPRHAGNIQSIAQVSCMQAMSDQQFWSCVRASDPRHHLGSVHGRLFFRHASAFWDAVRLYC
jgi:hypothetical protein